MTSTGMPNSRKRICDASQGIWIMKSGHSGRKKWHGKSISTVRRDLINGRERRRDRNEREAAGQLGHFRLSTSWICGIGQSRRSTVIGAREVLDQTANYCQLGAYPNSRRVQFRSSAQIHSWGRPLPTRQVRFATSAFLAMSSLVAIRVTIPTLRPASHHSSHSLTFLVV